MEKKGQEVDPEKLKWKTFGGRVLSEEEQQEANRLYEIHMLHEPEPNMVGFMVDTNSLTYWLTVKVEAFISLMKMGCDKPMAREDESYLAAYLFKFCKAYYLKQIENTFNDSARLVVNDLHDQFPVALSILAGADKSTYSRFLPTRKQQLESLEKSFTGTLESMPTRHGWGGNRRGKTDLSRLREHYESIVEDWREASRMCAEALAARRSAQRQQGWRQAIQQAYPTLPHNLIERLQPVRSWPEDISAICSEQGGTEAPDEIALEHAARLCNSADYGYKLSTLKKELQKQQRGISK